MKYKIPLFIVTLLLTTNLFSMQTLTYHDKKNLYFINKNSFEKKINNTSYEVNKKKFSFNYKEKKNITKFTNIYNHKNKKPNYFSGLIFSTILHQINNIENFQLNSNNKIKGLYGLLNKFVTNNNNIIMYFCDKEGNSILDYAINLENYKAAKYILSKAPDLVNWKKTIKNISPLLNLQTTPFKKVLSSNNAFKKGQFLIRHGAFVWKGYFETENNKNIKNQNEIKKLKNWYFKKWLQPNNPFKLNPPTEYHNLKIICL